jgi:hypothetical protein
MKQELKVMKKPELAIILTCIAALIFAAGIIIHVAYGQAFPPDNETMSQNSNNTISKNITTTTTKPVNKVTPLIGDPKCFLYGYEISCGPYVTYVP